MAVKLKLSEVDRLPELMGNNQHVVVIDDNGSPLLDVFDHYDLESVYMTLDIVSDPDLLDLIKEGLEQSNNGNIVDIELSNLIKETVR